MDILFAYIAGLLTLINPCVLPILPIVLASATQGHRHGPAALASGMAISFIAAGMLVIVFGAALGITERGMITAGAVAMLVFGSILLVPAFSERFATATAGLAGQADAALDTVDSGLRGQFLGGVLLGLVWSPCIGPTLGGAISLASQGQSIGYAFAVMVFFALGVVTVILALGYGTRDAIRRRKSLFQTLANRARPIMGLAFVAVALLLLTGANHRIEAWLLDTLPYWLTDLSVSV